MDVTKEKKENEAADDEDDDIGYIRYVLQSSHLSSVACDVCLLF